MFIVSVAVIIKILYQDLSSSISCLHQHYIDIYHEFWATGTNCLYKYCYQILLLVMNCSDFESYNISFAVIYVNSYQSGIIIFPLLLDYQFGVIAALGYYHHLFASGDIHKSLYWRCINVSKAYRQ